MNIYDTKIAIYEIRQKQEELTRLIYNLESKQVRRLEIPKADIDLNEGEHYAGIILGKGTGTSHHLILLPREPEKETDWDSAMKWASNVGGDLPTLREQSLLYANLKDQFKPTGYWSSKQNAERIDFAWAQNFNYGDQHCYDSDNEWRARAVRRILVKGS